MSTPPPARAGAACLQDPVGFSTSAASSSASAAAEALGELRSSLQDALAAEQQQQHPDALDAAATAQLQGSSMAAGAKPSHPLLAAVDAALLDLKLGKLQQ